MSLLRKKKNLKISSTPYRVLKILYLLNKGSYGLDELIENLSEDKIVSRTFSKDVILKYLHTIRTSGMTIIRHTEGVGSYQLEKSPFLMDLKDDELYALAIISNYLETLHQPNLIKTLNSLREKVFRYLEDDAVNKFKQYKNESFSIFQDQYSQYATLIKQLEQFCIEKQTLIITYSPMEGIEHIIYLEPERIEYHH
jgi:hypothetical protein